MKFRILVGACLVVIAYGVLYSNLPCWAELWQKSFTCQLQERPIDLSVGNIWNRPVK